MINLDGVRRLGRLMVLTAGILAAVLGHPFLIPGIHLRLPATHPEHDHMLSCASRQCRRCSRLGREGCRPRPARSQHSGT